MNKTYTTFNFLTIAIFLTFSSCQKKADYVILSGTIKNGNKTIELRSHYDTTDKSKRKIIHLDENGTFLDTIYVQNEELYAITDKTNMFEFYLTPSSKYILNYDTKKFKNEGILLKGDDIDINEYYIDKSRGPSFYDFDESNKSEKEIRSFLNCVKEKQIQRVNISKLPSLLKKHEESFIKYEYLRFLSLYLSINEINIPSIESKNELDIDYLNEEEYKKYQSYKYLLFDYYHNHLNQKAKENQKLNPSYSLYQNRIKELALIIPNEYIKNDLIAHDASFSLLNSKDIESCYNDFKKYYTGNDTIIKSEMQDLYYRFAKLKKGTPSPKFTNYKNFNGGKNSLNDFKGNYVFIDIWATWCGNCYGEIPYLKKLEQEYQDVVFLSITWKDDEDKWRKIIKKESLTGVQLFATKEDSSFFEEYTVNSVPRYILIDPEGNIVDHNTPRPSDDKLRTLFKDVGIN